MKVRIIAAALWLVAAVPLAIVFFGEDAMDWAQDRSRWSCSYPDGPTIGVTLYGGRHNLGDMSGRATCKRIGRGW